MANNCPTVLKQACVLFAVKGPCFPQHNQCEQETK